MNRTSSAIARLAVVPDAAPSPAERLLFASTLLVCRVDSDGSIVEANAALEELVGSPLVGVPVADLVEGASADRVAELLRDPDGDHEARLVLAPRAGAPSVTVTVRTGGDHSGVLLTAEVDRDPGAAPEPKAASRQSAVVVEIDGLDSVSERYGSDVGESLVETLHRVLEAGARGTDRITRTEGGGFVVLLENCILDGALVWAERVRARLREIRALGNGEAVTACFGVAERRASEAAEDVFGRAQSALRIARTDGRDQVRAAR